MEKRFIFIAVGLGVFFLPAASASFYTKIEYSTTQLETNRWQYTYDVTNISLTEPIKEFTIWFNYGKYDNLAIETQNPPAGNWDEIVWQPDPVIDSNGGYDGLVEVTASAIGIGQTVSNFAVSFDWLGEGTPGSQFYEIINPTTFETIDSGWTVPEPATALVLSFGLLLLRRSLRQ